jgi:hypothetical protein
VPVAPVAVGQMLAPWLATAPQSAPELQSTVWAKAEEDAITARAIAIARNVRDVALAEKRAILT